MTATPAVYWPTLHTSYIQQHTEDVGSRKPAQCGNSYRGNVQATETQKAFF